MSTEKFKLQISKFAYSSTSESSTQQLSPAPTLPAVRKRLLRSTHKSPPPSIHSKKRRQTGSTKSIPEEILADPHPVPDNIGPNLRVLFVGINPGLRSAQRGHHFAGPTNHFWPALHLSGLIDQALTWRDDSSLPDMYRLGITNLTHRCTRSAADLSLEEQKACVPELRAKIQRLRPKVVAFVGKGIAEIFLGRKLAQLGLQCEVIEWKDSQGGASKIFALPSTSGRVVAYQRSAQVNFFTELRKLADEGPT